METSVPDETIDLLQKELRRDIGSGDITTDSIFDENAVMTGTLTARQPGVISGLAAAEAVFRMLDADCLWRRKVGDGDVVSSGDEIASVRGNSRALASAERTALNILQKMSGISTLTSLFVSGTEGFPAKITDTRKTLPGLRWASKYAVSVGGGKNHRVGLYDAVLVKDNHIKAAGGMEAAIRLIRRNAGKDVRMEVETKTMEQVTEALLCGVDTIMLDNMDIPMIEEAVRFIDGRALVEASGGVSLDTVRKIAETGVDFISVGALTHSAPSLDIAFDVLE